LYVIPYTRILGEIKVILGNYRDLSGQLLGALQGYDRVSQGNNRNLPRI